MTESYESILVLLIIWIIKHHEKKCGFFWTTQIWLLLPKQTEGKFYLIYQMQLLHKNFNESKLHRKICMNFDILNMFPICYFVTF